MNTVAFVFSVIVGLLLAELRISRQNERRLVARGAIEPAGDVYRAMAAVYPGAFVAMAIEGAWRAGVAADWDGGPSWFVSGVLLFVVAKWLKYWAIRSLGERWTFRVLVVPGEPLVTTGPYRYIAHPNYVAVVGELIGAAMMVGAWVLGPIATLVFGGLLRARIQVENQALREAHLENVEGRASVDPRVGTGGDRQPGAGRRDR